MNTDKYRELRWKYGSRAIILLSLEILELDLLLSALKLAEEHLEMIECIPDIQRDIDRYRNRIKWGSDQLGLSVDEVDLLKAEFMYKDEKRRCLL